MAPGGSILEGNFQEFSRVTPHDHFLRSGLPHTASTPGRARGASTHHRATFTILVTHLWPSMSKLLVLPLLCTGSNVVGQPKNRDQVHSIESGKYLADIWQNILAVAKLTKQPSFTTLNSGKT